MFILHDDLASDTFFIGDLPLCTILLMNNSLFPWVILVPKKPGLVEIMDMEEDERYVLMDEIAAISKIIKQTYWPDKINVASLGNQVPQLHVHIIARFKTDDAWPEPVWGKGKRKYTETGLQETVEILRRECKKLDGFVTIANNP